MLGRLCDKHIAAVADPWKESSKMPANFDEGASPVNQP
jgi:hypothetical protein